MVDGDNHVTIHIPHYITPAVSTVVNKMHKSCAEIVNTTYISDEHFYQCIMHLYIDNFGNASRVTFRLAQMYYRVVMMPA